MNAALQAALKAAHRCMLWQMRATACVGVCNKSESVAEFHMACNVNAP